jgi:hypothetical protein
MSAPTIARTTAGAGHLSVAVAHWAGGHTISAEEITRRIVKARAEAHAAAVAEHGRAGRAAHRKAARLRRRATEDGGLVPAHMTALAAADHEAQRHDVAISALGEFTLPMLDPGHVRHRRHRIAAARCVILTLPAGAVIAGSWIWSGSVFLFTVLGGVGAALVRGDRPFELTVRPVPAELIAATPHVLPAAPATVVTETVPVDTGAWRDELRLYVEHAVAHADLQGRKGVHAVDLLAGQQQSGRYLGLTGATFPAKLRDAGLPVTGISIHGDNQLGVRHDQLTKALGRTPRLPAHLVPDLTEQEPSPGETPTGNPSPVHKLSA